MSFDFIQNNVSVLSKQNDLFDLKQIYFTFQFAENVSSLTQHNLKKTNCQWTEKSFIHTKLARKSH